jgi:hypothetical protein
MVMPMTGALAAADRQVVAGARLYMKQHGDMVAGRQIELVVKDGASSGETGKRLLQELIVNEKVDIIGGGLTATTPTVFGQERLGACLAVPLHEAVTPPLDRPVRLISRSSTPNTLGCPGECRAVKTVASNCSPSVRQWPV